MRQKIKAFIQKEVVLCVAFLLAVVSAFFVRPDGEYIGYIDYNTLAVLFCLMCVMAGLQKIGVFRWIAQRLLGLVHKDTQVILILVMLCFFFGMLITNDVALITFVPFTFTVGKFLDRETYRRMVLPVVVLQTIAANLGSMMTPIGNPQNLYLYGVSGMGTGEFLWLMLPYTALAFVLLVICCVVFGKYLERHEASESGKKGFSATGEFAGKKSLLAVYLVLFVLCLLTVARILPMWLVLAVTVLVVFVADKKVFLEVDYCLLLTFMAFFVFIGNMGRVPAFSELLQSLVKGHEVLVAVISSQFISNVPAALLLSGFTDNIPALIIGINMGGMGTLIASMASLISYKYVVAEVQESGLQGGKGKYFGYFTVIGICFLAALAILYVCIG